MVNAGLWAGVEVDYKWWSEAACD